MIDTALNAWDRHFADTEAQPQDSVVEVERTQQRLHARAVELAEQRVLTRQHHQQLQQGAVRHVELAHQFALVAERRTLEARHGEARQAFESQIALVQQASTRSVDAIARACSNAEQEHARLLRELATLTDNLYLRLRLQAALNAEQLDTLNLLLARQVMTLGAGQFEIDPDKLPDLRDSLDRLRKSNDGRIALPGLTIALGTLDAQHSQRTPGELTSRIGELAHQIDDLKRQAQAARALDAARARQQQLDKTMRQIEHELGLFDELGKLLLSAPQRAASTAEVLAALAAIETEQAHAQAAVQALRDEAAHSTRQLASLRTSHVARRTSHKNIVQQRERRGDSASVFSYLADLPHRAWTGAPGFALDQLAEQLEGYSNDCRRLLQLNDMLPHQVAELHACGLTKFSYMGGEESEIERITAFAAHLPQEAEALERKARSAVVNVTACLRELRDGLLTFKSRMRDFNRLISRRQLSDLAVFKIEPANELRLVDAIELLIAKAEQVDDGETFSLFNHASVLDDDALNRVKQVLIGEGEARGCLRVEHLFRLEFIVGKTGRATESFTDIDSAASNGTVLMAKLITGLALLHLMQDKRHRVQAVCYLDEASALDQRNQRSLIETADDFGFALIFASPAPLVTARYCVPISTQGGFNHISRQHWQLLEPLAALPQTVTAASAA